MFHWQAIVCLLMRFQKENVFFFFFPGRVSHILPYEILPFLMRYCPVSIPSNANQAHSNLHSGVELLTLKGVGGE